MSKRKHRDSRDFQVSDPMSVGGDIVGPGLDDGGSHEMHSVVLDMTRAVLLDGTTAAVAHLSRSGEPDATAISLLLEGRVNLTNDRARVLFIMDDDGAAALVAEITGLFGRANDGENFMRLVGERLAVM